MPEAGAWLSRQLVQLKPAAIINATAFSGRSDNDESPLDAPGVPVFQIALSTSERKAWAKAERGLSPSDLAMHVALPEVDGRIFSGVASFKKNQSLNPDLEYSRMAHHPDRARIRAITAKVNAWVRLAQKPVARKKIAFILSTYPGKSWQMAHAVGLDALKSVDAMIQDLATAGYTTGDDKAPVHQALQHETISLSLQDYHRLAESLPKSLRTKLQKDWGTPEDDFACKAGAFHFKAIRRGNMLIACSQNADAMKTAPTIITIYAAPLAIPMWPFISGCESIKNAMRWFMSARMERWNGCPEKRWLLVIPAGRKL